jgi:hypothetical protein
MEHMKGTKKLTVTTAFVAVVGMVAFAAGQSCTKAEENYDKGLDQKVTEVWFDCQKMQPGMTRADLSTMFARDTGGVAVPDSTPLSFREHQTFDYRRCKHIMIDVDFRASNSIEERPTDVITKVSKPYIDCSPKN